MCEFAQVESDIGNIRKQIMNVRNECSRVAARLDEKYSEMEKLTNSDDKFTMVKNGQKQEFIIREKHIKGAVTRPAELVDRGPEKRGRLPKNAQKRTEFKRGDGSKGGENSNGHQRNGGAVDGEAVDHFG